MHRYMYRYVSEALLYAHTVHEASHSEHTTLLPKGLRRTITCYWGWNRASKPQKHKVENGYGKVKRNSEQKV